MKTSGHEAVGKIKLAIDGTLMLCTILGLLASAGSGAESQPSSSATEFSVIEKEFRELPTTARRNTEPLFWLHGDESKERLEMYVEKVAQGGNGSFTVESRPHNDWLGEGWWRDLGICLEAARKNGLQMRIFDEKWWPSQSIGGKVPARYAAKELTATAIDVEGPRNVEEQGYAGENYVAAVAGRLNAEGKIEGDSLIDLKPNIHEGKLQWQAPAGRWKIMRFAHKTAPGLIQVGRSQLGVDGASKDCVDWFIQTVYQPHYDHFKQDFGKTINGFFYDEPEVPGDWGTELNGVLAEWKVDWKKAYVAHKFELAGEEQLAAAYQYREALVEAWGRTLYGGMTKWCHDRGVTSIGHFMEHDNLYLHQGFSGGDMTRLQKYSDMGGIDAVFTQFQMGKRVYQNACWQTPKLGSSISHAYGKTDDLTMVEIFGARGQDVTYPEMKWWADHMLVSGVNCLTPHSFNPRSLLDTDCPPYFYNGGFEPRWPLYRVFADYTSRISLMLSGGRHVCPVALLYLGQSGLAGKHIKPEQISESLQDALYDCDWLPYEVFENDMVLAGKELKLRNESYKVLIVPPVEVIPYATLAKAKAFFDKGGVVVAHGFLPEKSATLGKTSADIAKLCDGIWGVSQPSLAVCKTNAAGGRSYLLAAKPTPEDLQQILAGDAGIHPTLEVIEGKTDHWLHVLHRVKSGRDLFFIVNQNHLGAPRSFRFRIAAAGVPECWDAMRNEISSVPFSRNGGVAEVGLTLEPNESALLVFQPEERALLPRHAAGTVLSVQRDPSPIAEPAKLPGYDAASLLAGCSWVWYPEGDANQPPPPGTRYLRKELILPQDQTIKRAVFFGAVDDSFTLFANGKNAGSSPSAWHCPVELDLSAFLRPGTNQLAFSVANGGNKPNPAGLIGRFTIEFEAGPALTESVNQSWKASKEQSEGWTSSGFNDAAWLPAREVVALNASSWAVVTEAKTLSPAKADPFIGHCEIPSDFNAGKSRVYLELDEISPEAAARVSVNGSEAGGFIGKPFRLEVTRLLKSGVNTIRIEPFAPKTAQLSFE